MRINKQNLNVLGLFSTCPSSDYMWFELGGFGPGWVLTNLFKNVVKISGVDQPQVCVSAWSHKVLTVTLLLGCRKSISYTHAYITTLLQWYLAGCVPKIKKTLRLQTRKITFAGRLACYIQHLTSHVWFLDLSVVSWISVFKAWLIALYCDASVYWPCSCSITHSDSSKISPISDALRSMRLHSRYM